MISLSAYYIVEPVVFCGDTAMRNRSHKRLENGYGLYHGHRKARGEQ
jgi:hypothetical protein